MNKLLNFSQFAETFNGQQLYFVTLNIIMTVIYVRSVKNHYFIRV